MSCTHERQVDPVWVTETCSWTGEEVSHWEYQEPVSTFVDVSTHSYKCTQCGEVFYYSQRGKQIEERKL